MDKKYEILKDKIVQGTKRAIAKLIIEKKKEGKQLIISNKKNNE